MAKHLTTKGLGKGIIKSISSPANGIKTLLAKLIVGIIAGTRIGKESPKKESQNSRTCL